MPDRAYAWRTVARLACALAEPPPLPVGGGDDQAGARACQRSANAAVGAAGSARARLASVAPVQVLSVLMDEANDTPPPKASLPDRAIIVTIVTAIGGLVVGLVAMAFAIAAPLHGSLDNLRSDMREARAEDRADAIRIEERLKAIENRLTAIETSPHPPTLPLTPADPRYYGRL